MPGPVNATQDGEDRSSKRTQSIISFSSQLIERLHTIKDDPEAADALLEDVKSQTQRLEKYSSKPNHGMLGDEDMDRNGTNLWNLCTRLNREVGAKSSTSSASKLILASRVLAYQILHLCQWSSKASADIACHLMRIALKAAKVCTGHHDAQTARFVLQRAADYHGRLQQLSKTSGQDEAKECEQLEAEWTAMRIVLAWQDNQLEVAEHAYTKADNLLKTSNPASSEKIADSIYQVGKGLLAKQDFPMANKWLQRAWDLIDHQELQTMSRDAVELRIAILQTLVTALMGIQTTQSIEKAQNLVKYVESEIGDQPIILLLNLEMLSKSPAEAFDGDAYADVLRRMVRGFQPTEANFKLLAHQIHTLHGKCPALGCSVLEEFLTQLVKNGHSHWIDKLVIKRIHMAVGHRDFEGTVDDARKAVSRLEKPVSAEAAFAAQMLIWKKIDSNYNQKQYELAEKWCLLALKSAFGASGSTNKAKLERKLLLCALARNDYDYAKSIYYGMPPEAQQDPMTQYLLYQVTIRSGDAELASQCLENVAASSSTCMEFLYACVADSQRVGNKLTVIEAMKKLAEVHDYEYPGRLHLPALFRCNIMLLHGALTGKQADKNSVIADLCQIFDAVVAAVQRGPKDASGNILFDVKEIEWFCQNAYNLALKHANEWDLRCIVQVLTACATLVTCFPDDIAAEQASDLTLRSIFCNFLISSALVALARAEDNMEQQLQHYLVARKHIDQADLAIQLQIQSKNVDGPSSTDLLNKLAQLLAFDFEAAVALKKYEDLCEIVLKAEQCQNLETYKIMADCALRGHLHPEELFSVLRRIINQISDLDESNPTNLAKYTRCLFQVILPANEELCGRLLGEACSMAKGARGTAAAWPREEVEWIASTAYNHSIDLWCHDKPEECKWWAEKAINLAHYSDDGGQLEAVLQESYVKNKLGGQ